MTNRLPAVNGDPGQWGQILNDYLSVEHGENGTHVLGTGLVTENVSTVDASEATLTLAAMTVATMHDVTLKSNCTLTFPTAHKGQSFILVLKQDNVGLRLVTWPDTVLWAGDTAPILTTTAGAVDVLAFICIDGTNWLGFVSGQNMK